MGRFNGIGHFGGTTVRVLLFISLLFIISFGFMANAEHNCTHDHTCPVCICIDNCRETIKGLTKNPTVGLSYGIFSFLIIMLFVADRNANNETLVNLKIKLSD
jgi:hypothetical protein